MRIQVVLFSSVSTVGSPVAEAVITSTWDAREETKVRVIFLGIVPDATDR